MKQQGNIAQKLANLGYRMTPQRAMILSAIENSENHISAEEIYSQVVAEYPQVNISTVYRTLDLLKQLNLVTDTDFGGGQIRYHAGHKGHHHHLVCQECGTIIDLDESALFGLKDYLKSNYEFTADLRHLAIFGYCKKCRQ